MTPARLRECLALLGWTERGLARQLGYSLTAPRMWLAGLARVPQPVADWLEARAAHATTTPPPPRAPR